MVHDVFALHTIAGPHDVKFPFNVRDYQRYVFGDDKLAHTFGTDLAKAFIACGPTLGSAPSTNTTPSNQNDVAVAVLSAYTPTATHNLRKHFTAYLNRHFSANHAQLARTIDIIGAKDGCVVRLDPLAGRTDAHHIDKVLLGNKTLIVLADIRMSNDQEDGILKSLQIENRIIFAYLAKLDDATRPTALSEKLSTIVSPSLKDVHDVAQSRHFCMTDAFAHYVLGRGYGEFCRFVRGQDDWVARGLLDVAIGGGYVKEEMYRENCGFLEWEVGVRESV